MRSSQLPIPPPGFEGLSTQEQVEYVEALWDYITSRPNQVPIPEWHREVISERLTRYRLGVDEGRTWEEFEQELTKG
jgi:putative addiction module component (TIGR02574 family)